MKIPNFKISIQVFFLESWQLSDTGETKKENIHPCFIVINRLRGSDRGESLARYYLRDDSRNSLTFSAPPGPRDTTRLFSSIPESGRVRGTRVQQIETLLRILEGNTDPQSHVVPIPWSRRGTLKNYYLSKLLQIGKKDTRRQTLADIPLHRIQFWLNKLRDF